MNSKRGKGEPRQATADVRRETDRILGEVAKKHKKSKREFVMDSLDWTAIKDEVMRHHFPQLAKVGETDDGAVIIKDQKQPGKLIEVKLHDDKLYCNQEPDDKANSCEHVYFVLALPELGRQNARLQERINSLYRLVGRTPPS